MRRQHHRGGPRGAQRPRAPGGLCRDDRRGVGQGHEHKRRQAPHPRKGRHLSHPWPPSRVGRLCRLRPRHEGARPAGRGAGSRHAQRARGRADAAGAPPSPPAAAAAAATAAAAAAAAPDDQGQGGGLGAAARDPRPAAEHQQRPAPPPPRAAAEPRRPPAGAAPGNVPPAAAAGPGPRRRPPAAAAARPPAAAAAAARPGHPGHPHLGARRGLPRGEIPGVPLARQLHGPPNPHRGCHWKRHADAPAARQ
mmetsp:Transcript_32473/g.81852  ORF Transcript_32473/g.81852 Transcript_32473/m.81852 type:complete len:251 (+) Transcript_32473:221-973(+)